VAAEPKVDIEVVVKVTEKAQQADASGRGLHSSTSLFNLSRFGH
jgi:hypothetical protein